MRLVAHGFTYEHDIDYNEIFAPVAKMTTVRTLITVAAIRRWPLYQMDKKNIFFMVLLPRRFICSSPPTPLGLTCSPQLVYRL